MAVPNKILCGNRYSKLTVLRQEKTLSKAGFHKRWVCRCDCGEITSVRSTPLRSGTTRSCGCLKNEIAKKLKTTHGLSKCKSYASWHSMMSRCQNKNDIGYKNYGGRGIRVCDRWASLADFIADMGERPEGMSLDRINNNGNYEPLNCKWSTRDEQANNTRYNVFAEYNGKRHSLSVWAKMSGIPASTFNRRISMGWEMKRAMETPVAGRVLS